MAVKRGFHQATSHLVFPCPLDQLGDNHNLSSQNDWQHSALVPDSCSTIPDGNVEVVGTSPYMEKREAYFYILKANKSKNTPYVQYESWLLWTLGRAYEIS